MRAGLAWLLLFAGAGCNQIFGNNQVGHIDAAPFEGPGIDARFGTLTLTWAVQSSPTVMSYEAITGANVKVGSLTDLTDLQDLTIDSDGNFLVPYAILELMPRYRLVYTPADGIPVEVQTNLGNGHFVVPRIGRIDRTVWPTVPAAGKINLDLTAMGGPATYTHLRIFGTGLWSSFTTEAPQTSATFVNYSNFNSDSGPRGVPMSASSDEIVITDGPTNNSTGATGFATMTLDGFDGSGNPINPVVSAWQVAGTMMNLRVSSNQFAQPSYSQRAAGLWNEGGPSSTTDTLWGGVIATTTVAPFTDAPVNSGIPNTTTGEFYQPVFAPLAQTQSLNEVFLDPYVGANVFPTAAYQFGSTTRQFTGTTTTVRAGVQMIMLNDGTPANESVFDKGVGIAQQVLIKPTGGSSTVDIVMSTDGKMITRPAAGSTFELTFGTDDSTAPSDCMVTLYRVESTALTTIRRYQVNALPTAALPILVDANLIDNSHSYAFGISCFRGHPNSATGDFATIAFPFAVSTIYTKSFTAP